jgi:hypothetical protein
MPRRTIEGKAGPVKEPWHPLAIAWWKDVWRSAMAVRYTKADVHGLYLLLDLVDRYWRGERALAGEIRLQRQAFGITPLDRWRLQWEAIGDALPKKRPAYVPPPAGPAPETPGPAGTNEAESIDPRRRFLRAV